MAYKQLKTPNLNHTDFPGWCLRFVRNSFDIESKYEYAWQAWEASKTKHTGDLPGDAAVPVWFTWTGTIDGVTRNWGDVAIHVPGKGVFGTPMRGGGNSNAWHPSVQARAKALGGGAKYVGWTEDVNDVRVVEYVPDPPKPTGNTYTVKRGDTLSKIAAAHGTTWDKLYDLNRAIIGPNPNLIKPGQVLQVSAAPPAAHYTVVSGDSLSKIAARFGTTWQQLHAWNRGIIGPDPSKIFPGQKLRVK